MQLNSSDSLRGQFRLFPDYFTPRSNWDKNIDSGWLMDHFHPNWLFSDTTKIFQIPPETVPIDTPAHHKRIIRRLSARLYSFFLIVSLSGLILSG